MAFRAFRSLIPPVSRFFFFSPATTTAPPIPRHVFTRNLPWIPPTTAFHSLADTRHPKRKPSDKSRRKRASLRPPGPIAWVKYVPGEPILPNQPNEGSVKRRNVKKRAKQRIAFTMSEKRKCKVLMQEAKKRKLMKRVERKMAAVAREKAWQERLVELKRIDKDGSLA